MGKTDSILELRRRRRRLVILNDADNWQPTALFRDLLPVGKAMSSGN